jgi:pSer/pThr/pTyr-binding forkhead associated (FHA) protein
MKTCSNCSEKSNDDNTRFCMSCGSDLNEPELSQNNKTNEPNLGSSQIKNEINDDTILVEKIGKLILPDNTFFVIDNSQKLVGLTNLKQFTENDLELISRSHFTIYKKDEKYFIKDGVTNVQNKSSKHHTFLNDEKLTEVEFELKNNDKILVSDVEMLFEV